MRTIIFGIGLLLICMTIIWAQQAQSVSQSVPNSEIKNQLARVATRIDEGDDKALLEVAKLPADVSVPFIDGYLQFYREESAEYQMAREALANVPNYAIYLKNRIVEASSKGGGDERAFELLSVAGTPEAEAIVAPYLFDFSMTPGNGHILSSVNAISASLALGRMALSDAPTSAKPESYKSKDIIAWQKWAIEKGLVPQSKKAEVPQWLVELETSTTPPQTALALQTEPPSSFASITQAPVQQAKSGASPTPTVAAETKLETSRGFLSISIVIIVSAIAALTAFLMRRNSS